MVNKAKSVGDDSWKVGRIICQVARSFESFAILCSMTMVAIQTKFVFEEGGMVPVKKMLKCIFWSFGSCMNGFAYCNMQTHHTSRWYMDLWEVY